MKKYLKIIVIVLVVSLLVGCSLTYENEKKEYLKGQYNVEMKIKDYGIITLTLDADTAPITVTNFMNLVKEGFYNNNKIHRAMKGFVIQGGSDSVGSKETIKGEFDANGISNDISHVRGTISMARMGDNHSNYDSASTQFFIVQEDSISLDHYYAGFGSVTSGMEVVDKICDTIKNTDNMGMILDEDEMPIIEYIKEIEK